MFRQLATIVIIMHHTLNVAVLAFDPFVGVGVQRLHIDQAITIMQTDVVANALSDTNTRAHGMRQVSTHASIAQNTTITTISDTPITMSDISIDSTISQPFDHPSYASFHFGTRGRHLTFSKPVRLDIPVSGVDDGSEVLVLSHHAGDEKYSQTGLTSSARAECLSDGSSSTSLGPRIVRNGIVTVYTCGASDFVVTYTGGANDANFVDNSTKTKTITVTTTDTAGEHTVANLTVTVDFHSINGVDPSDPGVRDSYANENSFSLTSPSGTTVPLLNTNTYGSNNAPRVVVSFDDNATTHPSDTPSTGTFRPASALNAFDGETALGDWIFTFGDNAGGDGLIIHKVDLNFSTNNTISPPPPSSPSDPSTLNCQRVTYTGGANTTHFVDATTKTFDISVTSATIGDNSVIETLSVGVDFQSIDGTDPTNPGAGNAYSSELSMRITSPGGTVRNLVNANNYDNGASSRVTATFFDSATSTVSGVPSTGNFKPQELFAILSGQSAIGNWSFALEDNTNDDGVILHAVYLDFCYASTTPPPPPPPGPTCHRVTYTGGANGANYVDNSTKNKTIVVAATDIGNNTLVDTLKVSIDFHSINGTDYNNPGTGPSRASENIFQITSPDGTRRTIVRRGTYGNANAPRVTATFADEYTTPPSGTPTTGNFSPRQSFAPFSGQNATGNWIFRFRDRRANNGLILHAVHLDFCYPTPSGQVTISTATGINLGSHQPLNTPQTIDTNTTATFSVSDTLGTDAGRYTTLQASNLTAGTETIPAANILISHPGAITTTSGTSNPLLGFGSTIATSYVALSTPITYIKRDTGPNGGVTGSYATNPSFRVIVPAYQTPGDYTGTITYTLYEN